MLDFEELATVLGMRVYGAQDGAVSYVVVGHPDGTFTASYGIHGGDKHQTTYLPARFGTRDAAETALSDVYKTLVLKN